MLEVFASFICAFIMSLLGYYVINKVVKPQNNRPYWIKIFLILLLTVISIILHPIQYTGLYTITIFLLNIIIYKYLFNITFEESIISCSILMFLIICSDIIYSIILMIFFSTSKIRTDYIIMLISNVIVSVITIVLFRIKALQVQLIKFYDNIVPKKSINNIAFIILIIFELTSLVYNMVNSDIFRLEYIINLIIVVILVIITIIFIQSKNNYKKLAAEYDSLFNYIQTFEDWIEKEQLNRHEYKNQLAVLRCLTNEKKVKDKIDEILEDNINIEGQAVTQLKYLPKGGIKGLMYYKAALAQKQKINLTADVSIDSKGILTKLTEQKIRILCKLIGIYFDNAIEAAAESRKKNLTIEIYELENKVNFIFSNTFKKHRNMKDRNKKGVSSKGIGRGNGLYFATKLIKENPWIQERQEIIDNYYIQEISIKNIKNNKK